MGFFSDLKEDLSQAVNELMPEDALATEDAYKAEEVENVEATKGEATKEENSTNVVEETAIEEETEAAEVTEDFSYDSFSEQDLSELDALLERVDSIEVQGMEEVEGTQAENAVSEGEQSVVEAVAPIVERHYTEEIVRGDEKKMDGQMKSALDETALITSGMTITGDIASEGSMEILGTINGNIEILGKLNITGNIMGNSKAAEIFADGAKITGEVISEGSVKIGQSSVIIGNITATSAVIAGAVKGDIDVKGPVVLDASAIVMGNIKSKSVQINNGAVIEGLCSQCYADVNPTSFFDDYKKPKNK